MAPAELYDLEENPTGFRKFIGQNDLVMVGSTKQCDIKLPAAEGSQVHIEYNPKFNSFSIYIKSGNAKIIRQGEEIRLSGNPTSLEHNDIINIGNYPLRFNNDDEYNFKGLEKSAVLEQPTPRNGKKVMAAEDLASIKSETRVMTLEEKAKEREKDRGVYAAVRMDTRILLKEIENCLRDYEDEDRKYNEPDLLDLQVLILGAVAKGINVKSYLTRFDSIKNKSPKRK